MRTLYVVGFIAGIALTLAASTRPSAAMVIYPWCANYGGGGKGGVRSQQLRVHLLPAMYGDDVGQWRDLLSKSVVSAVSSADDLCSTDKALAFFSFNECAAAGASGRAEPNWKEAPGSIDDWSGRPAWDE